MTVCLTRMLYLAAQYYGQFTEPQRTSAIINTGYFTGDRYSLLSEHGRNPASSCLQLDPSQQGGQKEVASGPGFISLALSYSIVRWQTDNGESQRDHHLAAAQRLKLPRSFCPAVGGAIYRSSLPVGLVVLSCARRGRRGPKDSTCITRLKWAIIARASYSSSQASGRAPLSDSLPLPSRRVGGYPRGPVPALHP